MASIYVGSPSCAVTEGVDRNGKSTAGHQHYLCRQCRKPWTLTFTYTTSQRSTHQRKIIDMTINGSGCRASPHIIGIGLNTIFPSFKKLSPQSVTSRIKAGWGVIVCVKREEQRGYVGWVGSYISIHFLSLNPLLVRRRRYSRGERYPSALCGCHSL
ncbi:hypothetical protein LAD59_22435 [Klebsiella pneumoniae]|nr:hypothetical protein [Klebsiella pneumoniae]